MPPKPPYCKNSSEYPMHPECAAAMIKTAYEKSCKDSADATAIFFNEIAAAQQNYIKALKKILPSEWDEPKYPLDK